MKKIDLPEMGGGHNFRGGEEESLEGIFELKPE